MIITRTPLRISLVGGATDLPEFYVPNDYGAVVSFAIAHHFTCAVNKRFENNIRVGYTKTEIVRKVTDIEHPLVRAALIRMRIKSRIEINTISDIPGRGTGLGSSSSLMVGLLNALTQYAIMENIQYGPYDDVAEEAFALEADYLGKKMGKQDHYAAAYGGMNHIRFNYDGSVDLKPLPKYREYLEKIERRICLFYTGLTRSSQDTLVEQSKNTQNDRRVVEALLRMRSLADQVYGELLGGNFDAVGEALDENWQLKKTLAQGISNPDIDHWHRVGMGAGALGAKICGAGGGGFMLFWCRPEDKEKIQDAVPLRYVPIKIAPRGTHIAYMEGFND